MKTQAEKYLVLSVVYRKKFDNSREKKGEEKHSDYHTAADAAVVTSTHVHALFI